MSTTVARCKSKLISNKISPYLLALYFFLNFAISVPSVSIQFQYVNRYNLGVGTITMIKGLISIPWIFKPIAAFTPLGLFPFVCLTLSLVSTCMLIPMNPYILVTCLFFFELCCVSLDVFIDGFMVEMVGTQNSKGSVQTLATIAKACGRMLGTFSGALLYHSVHDRISFLAAAIAGQCILLSRFMFTKHTEDTQRPSTLTLGSNIRTTRELYNDTQTWLFEHKLFIIFIVCLCFQPSMQSSSVYYAQTNMKLSDVNFGSLGVFSNLAQIIATFAFGICFTKIPYKPMIALGIACGSTLSLIFAVYAAYAEQHPNITTTQHTVFFAITNSLDVAIETIAWMPVIIVASRICANHVDHAFRYALLTSTMNICGILSVEAGALIAQLWFHDPRNVRLKELTTALFLTELLSFIPLAALILCMPNKPPDDTNKEIDIINTT